MKTLPYSGKFSNGANFCIFRILIQHTSKWVRPANHDVTVLHVQRHVRVCEKQTHTKLKTTKIYSGGLWSIIRKFPLTKISRYTVSYGSTNY